MNNNEELKITSFDHYQELTRLTAKYPKELAIPYCTLGLTGEAGELANIVKKTIRDNAPIDKIFSEAGDILWYLARLLDEAGFKLSDVAEANIKKLDERYKTGTIGGNGESIEERLSERDFIIT